MNVGQIQCFYGEATYSQLYNSHGRAQAPKSLTSQHKLYTSVKTSRTCKSRLYNSVRA